VKTLKTMFHPHRYFGALFALVILAFSAPTARADIKWTLDDVVMDGGSLSFFTVDITGTFLQTKGGFTSSNITVVETYEIDDTPQTISYPFSGPVNGPGYTQTSQYPVPPCILGPPCPVAGSATLHIFIGPLVALPGTYSALGSFFYDSGHTASFCAEGHVCEITATSMPAPEPSFWVMASVAFAGLLVVVIFRRRNPAGPNSP
jgi:hypothetical protein